MPADWFPKSVEMLRFLPEIILTVTGTLLMVIEPVAGRRWSKTYGHITILGLAAALAAAVAACQKPGPAFSGMLMADGFAAFFRVLVIGVGILTVLASYRYLEREGVDTGEYYALILFSVTGQCVMVTASDLIMIFIGLEISSIATYVLAGYLREDKRANEAAVKTHAALPDLEDAHRALPDHAGVVEKDVADTSAEDNAKRRPEQKVIGLHHRHRRLARLPQTVLPDQPHHPAPAEHQTDNVGERIPAQVKRPDMKRPNIKQMRDGQSRRVDIGEL